MPPKGAQKANAAPPSTPKAKTKPKAPAAKAVQDATPAKPAIPSPTPRKKKAPPAFKSVAHESNVGPFQIEVKHEGSTSTAQQTADGDYGHTLKLEACNPFKLLKTIKFTTGDYAGCEAIVLQPAKPFPFLKIPKEARAKIYTFYFAPSRITNSHIALEGKRPNKNVYAKMYAEGSKYRVGLLAVNKEVYDEALPILYNHMMRFDNTTTVLDFLGQLENSVRPRITNIRIKQYIKTTARNAMHFLAESPNITTLYIESGVYSGDEPAKAAKEFYDAGYKFLEAVGARRGDKLAGADVVLFGADAFTYKPDEDRKKEAWDGEMVDEFRKELKARLN